MRSWSWLTGQQICPPVWHWGILLEDRSLDINFQRGLIGEDVTSLWYFAKLEKVVREEASKQGKQEKTKISLQLLSKTRSYYYYMKHILKSLEINCYYSAQKLDSFYKLVQPRRKKPIKKIAYYQSWLKVFSHFKLLNKLLHNNICM